MGAFAAGLLAYGAGSFADRFHRLRLEGAGAVATGEVVGHSVFTCRNGILCTERVPLPGIYGTAAFKENLNRSCVPRRRRCHTLIKVAFAYNGAQYLIAQPVGRDAFDMLGQGSKVAVLVNRNDPVGSLLRDHNPEGYRFWVSVALLWFAWFIISLFRRPLGSFPRR